MRYESKFGILRSGLYWKAWGYCIYSGKQLEETFSGPSRRLDALRFANRLLMNYKRLGFKMDDKKKSGILWESARNLELAKGSEIRGIALKLGLTKPTVQSILNMGEKHNSFEFAKVANYLLRDEWLSWDIENKPFDSMVIKKVALREVFPVGNYKVTPKIEKIKPTNEKKALDARGQFCVTKGHENREAMSCHYTGLSQQDLGKGMGYKGDSLISAWLCKECHDDFDQYRQYDGIMTEFQKVEHSQEFLMAIAKTLLEKKAQGKIKEI